MTSLRLIADDLTGALDTAAEFVGVTGPVSTFWHGAIPSALPANAALDSGTRERDAAAATETVAALTPVLEGAGIAFKKVDSLMRGATLAEVAACMRVGGWRHAILAPAFPYQGRVTRGGVQYARDLRDGWSAVGPDIVAQLQRLGLTAQRTRQDGSLVPGVTVFDAETDADLDRIVANYGTHDDTLWIGTGGLAQALAWHAPAFAGADLPPPLLGLFGSDQPVTAAQLAACGTDWLSLSNGDAADISVVRDRLRTRGRLVASLKLPPGLARDDAARRIGTSLHGLVRDLAPPGTLLVAGGETLRGLCLSLGAHSLDVQGRLAPGLPRSILRGGLWDGVTVVSKSGAFGSPTLLRDLLRGAHIVTERTA
jgi:D-threonate/D-erythronate kinase